MIWAEEMHLVSDSDLQNLIDASIFSEHGKKELYNTLTSKSKRALEMFKAQARDMDGR